jgi:hypothetical protein
MHPGGLLACGRGRILGSAARQHAGVETGVQRHPALKIEPVHLATPAASWIGVSGRPSGSSCCFIGGARRPVGLVARDLAAVDVQDLSGDVGR